MNIITNKEVFSTDNQAGLPQKRQGRPRKINLSAVSNSNQNPTPQSSTPPNSQPPANPSPQNPPAEAPKTVFYQAAKPRTQSPFARRTPLGGVPPSGRTPLESTSSSEGRAPFNSARSIDPRYGQPPVADPARSQSRPQLGRPMLSRNQANASRPGYSANPSTRAINRANVSAYPKDSAANFMAPRGQSAPLGPVHRPSIRPTSTQKLKIIPLGGLEEIGKNMTVFEYGNDIFIVDMGLMFPDYDMFGIDYIIPDTSYLMDKKDKIRGIFITHGHLDHIGAVPYLIEKLGFPPIYGTQVTIGMVKQRLEEFNLVGRNRLNTVEADKDVIQLGAFRIFAFHLVHSIPGAVGLEIETPNGRIVLATDWKFDYTPAGGRPVDFQTLAAIGTRGVDLLMSDSTNAEKPGHSISERVVEQALASAIEEAPGRVIIAMFASNISRIQQTLNVAHKYGRKVMVVGRSMQQNVEMAIGMKAIVIPPNTLIADRESNRFNDNQLLILCTGSQGEDRSALVRMANGDHRVIKIKKGDTVILSASPIPGNEKSISTIMDILYKAGAMVIYNKILDVHSSGHAYAEDLKLLIALLRPKFFLPVHGERSKLIMHGKLAEEVGVDKDNILIGENGGVVEIDSNGKTEITEMHVPSGYVMVDGLGVGDVGNIVLRDRQAMAQDGIFVTIVVYDTKAHKFITSPDIISRGFIYMRENEQFVNDIRNEIKRFLQKAAESKNIDINLVKADLRDYISKLLYEKTERSPMVIPVLIEV